MVVARSDTLHKFLGFLSLSFRDVRKRTQIPPDGWIGHVDGILVVIKRQYAHRSTCSLRGSLADVVASRKRLSGRWIELKLIHRQRGTVKIIPPRRIVTSGQCPELIISRHSFKLSKSRSNIHPRTILSLLFADNAFPLLNFR